MNGNEFKRSVNNNSTEGSKRGKNNREAFFSKFKPGDVVRFKYRDLGYGAPESMMVIGESRALLTKSKKESGETKRKLLGILCMWFDRNGVLRKDKFDFRELELLVSN